MQEEVTPLPAFGFSVDASFRIGPAHLSFDGCQRKGTIRYEDHVMRIAEVEALNGHL